MSLTTFVSQMTNPMSPPSTPIRHFFFQLKGGGVPLPDSLICCRARRVTYNLKFFRFLFFFRRDIKFAKYVFPWEPSRNWKVFSKFAMAKFRAHLMELSCCRNFLVGLRSSSFRNKSRVCLFSHNLRQESLGTSCLFIFLATQT